MDPVSLARGFILGFTIAATVGPISLLVIRRTLAEGRAVGLASGLGVATADATYGGIAAFGLTAITSLLVGGGRLLGLVGGIFLVWLAWRIVRSEPTGPTADRLFSGSSSWSRRAWNPSTRPRASASGKSRRRSK